MFNRLFIEHPKTVNETYFEHLVHAIGFAVKLQMAAIACFIHALVPGFCVKTGSRLVLELHHRMVAFRVTNSKSSAQEVLEHEAIEYMI
jgi:hypothetical protein